MLEVTIYHNHTSRFEPYEDGHHLVAATSHHLDLPPETGPEAVADWAFETFNADLDQLAPRRDTPTGEVTFLAGCVYRLLGHRSLSVGDVVEVTSGSTTHWLACERFGWRGITAPSRTTGHRLTARAVYEHLRRFRNWT